MSENAMLTEKKCFHAFQGNNFKLLVLPSVQQQKLSKSKGLKQRKSVSTHTVENGTRVYIYIYIFFFFRLY